MNRFFFSKTRRQKGRVVKRGGASSHSLDESEYFDPLESPAHMDHIPPLQGDTFRPRRRKEMILPHGPLGLPPPRTRQTTKNVPPPKQRRQTTKNVSPPLPRTHTQTRQTNNNVPPPPPPHRTQNGSMSPFLPSKANSPDSPPWVMQQNHLGPRGTRRVRPPQPPLPQYEKMHIQGIIDYAKILLTKRLTTTDSLSTYAMKVYQLLIYVFLLKPNYYYHSNIDDTMVASLKNVQDKLITMVAGISIDYYVDEEEESNVSRLRKMYEIIKK